MNDLDARFAMLGLIDDDEQFVWACQAFIKLVRDRWAAYLELEGTDDA